MPDVERYESGGRKFVKIHHDAAYRGPHTALAERTADGDVMVTEIGYYDETIVLTRAQLLALGFTEVPNAGA